MSQADLWDVAGVKRAARAVQDRQKGKPSCGYAPKLPRSDKVFAKGAAGQGPGYQGPDSKIDMQVWGPGPWLRSYWCLVYRGRTFAGEMRVAFFDTDGTLGHIDPTVYNAQGERAHRDGTRCWGRNSAALNGCDGCKRQDIARKALALVGQRVKVNLAGDPMFGGVAVRWGTLTGVQGDRLEFSGMRDCSGIADREQYSALEHVRDIEADRMALV